MSLRVVHLVVFKMGRARHLRGPIILTIGFEPESRSMSCRCVKSTDQALGDIDQA